MVGELGKKRGKLVVRDGECKGQFLSLIPQTKEQGGLMVSPVARMLSSKDGRNGKFVFLRAKLNKRWKLAIC